jgi:hypothetical protein
MLTRKLGYLSAIIAVAVALSLTACKRDKSTVSPVDNNITEETGYADDQAKLDQTFDEVENFSDEAESMGSVGLKGGSITLSGCATVTRDTVGPVDSIIIDFGSTNCLCKDNRNRRGKIIITYTGGHYRDSGFVHSITFSNYYVNDNYVYGSKTIANKGHNTAGHLYYTIAVDGHIVLNSTHDTISHVSNRTRTWVTGANTQQISDDEYEITGNGTMTRANGQKYTINITKGLHIALNCHWIESGTVSITPNGATFARVLDYGSGICDDQATLTVNGKTKTILLK